MKTLTEKFIEFRKELLELKLNIMNVRREFRRKYKEMKAK